MGSAPVADWIGADYNSDIVNMRDWSDAYFVAIHGAGGTGTTTFTMESCDDVSATTATAIEFEYKRITGSADTDSGWTAATTTGFTTTANANDIYIMHARAEDLYSTNQFIRLDGADVDSTAVLGGCLIILDGGRYGSGSAYRTVLS